MSRGIDSFMIEYRKTEVVFDASGNATIAIAFEDRFLDTPQMTIIEDAADVAAGAVYSVTIVNYSGFTLHVANSKYRSTRRAIYWIAHERT